MSDMDMGVTQYWALIDADGSGFLDREEFEGVMALSGVLSSQMEIDTCIEQFNVGPEEITQDVYYDWLLSTDTAWMNQPRRRSKGDDHRDVLLLQREAARFDPDVLEALQALWILVDADHSGAVDKEEYLALHYHLYQAMHPQELLNLSARKRKKAEAKALKMAEGEWEFDSQGRAEMNRDRFKLSMFQLVDALIPQDEDFGPPRRALDSEEYLRMLEWLVDRLCVLDDHQGEDETVMPQFRWDHSDTDWLEQLPPPLFSDEKDAKPRLLEGDRIIARLLMLHEDDAPEEVKRRRRRRRKKLLGEPLSDDEVEFVEGKVPYHLQQKRSRIRSTDLNDKLAQWEAQQREAKAKAKGEEQRRRSERAARRRKSMDSARTVSFDESMSTTSSKKVYLKKYKRPSASSVDHLKGFVKNSIKGKSSGYGKDTWEPSVGDELEGLSSLTWHSCTVEAIAGLAYLCYFPHSDCREYLPLEHLRRKMRSTKRTVIRRKLPPQKEMGDTEPRYQVDMAYTQYDRSLYCHNRVLGYLYAMGPEKIHTTSQIDAPPVRSTRWSWEAELLRMPDAPAFAQTAPARPGTRAERRADFAATRAGLDVLDRTGHIGRDSYVRPRTAGARMELGPRRLPQNLDADVTGTRPPSRSTFLERPPTRNTPAREAVLQEFRRRAKEARDAAAKA